MVVIPLATFLKKMMNNIGLEILEQFTDDPQSATNHLVLGLDLDQRKEARGLQGKKSYNNWV